MQAFKGPVIEDMRRILITSDYEIFGNGTGDVRQHVIDPTRRMIEIAEKHGIPLVIFFELEEYLAFERHASVLRGELGYDPATLMREQARRLVNGGHDVQLHLHPQWYGATYEGGKWQLRHEKLTVDALFETLPETIRFMAERKARLEEVVGDGVRHQVCAYRAGGFAAQPGTRLIPALSENGFYCDSSVVHGLTRNARHVQLDYTQAPPGRRSWRVSTDVAVEDKSGKLVEMPIHSVMQRRYQQGTFARIKAKFSKNVPKDRQMEMIQQLGIRWSPAGIWKFLTGRVPIKLDFNNLSARTVLKWIDQAPAPINGDPDVLVLIGHSKEHINDAEFDKLLAGLKKRPEVKAVTFPSLMGEFGFQREAGAAVAGGKLEQRAV